MVYRNGFLQCFYFSNISLFILLLSCMHVCNLDAFFASALQFHLCVSVQQNICCFFLFFPLFFLFFPSQAETDREAERFVAVGLKCSCHSMCVLFSSQPMQTCTGMNVWLPMPWEGLLVCICMQLQRNLFFWQVGYKRMLATSWEASRSKSFRSRGCSLWFFGEGGDKRKMYFLDASFLDPCYCICCLPLPTPVLALLAMLPYAHALLYKMLTLVYTI